MTPSSEHDWMRLALAVLFDACGTDEALAAIRDAAPREALRGRVERALADQGAAMPAGDLGDNLLLALLALRVKFPRPEAMAKVELNISMRAARDRRGAT